MNSRVAIFGADGQLGQALQCAFSDKAPGAQVLAFGRWADLTDSNTWVDQLVAFAPDIIVNAAAFTAVDACQREPDVAHRVNTLGVKVLARWSRTLQAKLIHISTDYVFGDGGQLPRTEEHEVKPLNVYGLTKANGEDAIREIWVDHVILRTSWLYGPRAGNFFATIMALAETKDYVNVVENEASCPTFAPDLGEAIVAVCEQLSTGKPRFGTFHCAGCEGYTRLQFAQAIMAARAQAGMRVVRINATTQEAYGAPARRPLDSRMDCAAFEAAYGLVLPGLSERLPNLIASLAGQKLG